MSTPQPLPASPFRSGLLALLGAATAIAAELPSFRGADGSGVIDTWQGATVAEAKQGSLLWSSEERHFGVGWGYGTGPENKGRTTVMSCGFSGPVAVGDAVFFSWFLPSGAVVDEAVRAKAKDQRPEAWAVDADDLLVCIDAATGRTRWKAVHAGKGLNWGYHRKCPWTHACVVDGRVVWLGSAGRVYCQALDDGGTLWESHTGEAFQEFEKLRAKMRAAASVETWQPGVRVKDGDSTSPLDSSPCVVAGVVVINDGLCDSGYRGIVAEGAGLVGLDAGDGRGLWRIPQAAGAYVSPVPYRAEGVDLVISVAPQRVLAVEPRSGRIVWSIDEGMDAGVTPAVGGGFLLVQRHRVRGALKDIPEGTKGLSCWRLVGGAAPEKLWEKPPGDYSGPYSAPVIAGGHGYALCRTGLVCVELASGTVVATREKIGDGYQPLLASGDLLLAGSDLVRLDPRDFRSLGSLPVGREPYTSAFIAAGRVYLRGRLPGYDGKNRDGTQPPEPGCIHCVDLRR